MATETKKNETVEQEVDLVGLLAEADAAEAEELEILKKAEEIRKARAEKNAAIMAQLEPIIAPFRSQIEEVQKALGTLTVTQKAEKDALTAKHAEERKSLDAEMEAILEALESQGVKRELVLPKKGGGGATGKRGPGLKAAALGHIGSADDPVMVTAPRRRAGDGVPEEHAYYCDGTYFYGRMSDGSWSQSERLSEVSSSHGWHDTKDVAAALAFAAGKPYSIMANPGAVFANGVMVPNGAPTAVSETETV